MLKQESSVRSVSPAVADTLYRLEMVKYPILMRLRDAWSDDGAVNIVHITALYGSA